MKNFRKFALSFTQQSNTFGKGRDHDGRRDHDRHDDYERDYEDDYDGRGRDDDRDHDRADVNGGDSGTPPSDDD